MNKEKLTYLSPETETLVVRFEGVVCTSPNSVNTIFQTEYLSRELDEDVDDL